VQVFIEPCQGTLSHRHHAVFPALALADGHQPVVVVALRKLQPYQFCAPDSRRVKQRPTEAAKRACPLTAASAGGTRHGNR
jgi:hypothetical protein